MKKGVLSPVLPTLDEVIEDPSRALAFQARKQISKNGRGRTVNIPLQEISLEVRQRFMPPKKEVRIEHLPDGGMKVTRLADGLIWIHDPPVPEDSPGQWTMGGGGGGKAGSHTRGEKPTPQRNPLRHHDPGLPKTVSDRHAAALDFRHRSFNGKDEAGHEFVFEVIGGGFGRGSGKKKRLSAKAARTKSDRKNAKKGKKNRGGKPSENE